MIKRIAVFASGAGSNAQKIVEYFQNKSSDISVSLIICNNPEAGVLKVAEKSKIKSILISKEQFKDPDQLIEVLEKEKIDLIVLAGFLWLIPIKIIRRFKEKIINIHPALLPNYGGKGMYGIAVHKAVKAAGIKETGITIHYVDEKFDEGEIIFQAKCMIEEMDTPEDIAIKVQKMEHEFYSKVIESLLI